MTTYATYSINAAVTITATNTSGETDSVTPTIKISSLPDFDENLSTIDISATETSISWGGSYIDTIEIQYVGYSNANGYPDESSIIDSNTTLLQSRDSPYILPTNQLLPNTFYNFSVIASNIIGTTGQVLAGPGSGFTDILTYPSSMSNLTLSSNMPTYSVISWDNKIENVATFTMSNLTQNTSNVFTLPSNQTTSNSILIDGLDANTEYEVTIEPYNVIASTGSINFAGSSNIKYVTLPSFTPPVHYVSTSNIVATFQPSMNSYSNIHIYFASNMDANNSVYISSNLIPYGTRNYEFNDLQENISYNIKYTPYNRIGIAGAPIQNSNITTLTSLGTLEYDTRTNTLSWDSSFISYSYVRISQKDTSSVVYNTDKIYTTSTEVYLTQPDNVLLTVTAYNEQDIEGQKRQIRLQQIGSVYYVYNLNV